MEQRNYAMGIIEFDSVPVGYRIINHVLKNIEIAHYEDKLLARNKYVAIFNGSYENVETAITLAITCDNNHVLDFALIGNLHQELHEFMDGRWHHQEKDGVVDLAVVEADTYAACIDKTNQILHFANISLIDINYGNSLDGKCLITLQGNTSNLMAAIEKLGTGELLLTPVPQLLEKILSRSALVVQEDI